MFWRRATSATVAFSTIALFERSVQWWNLALPAEITATGERPPQSVGPGGVADASLYARIRRAGLVDVVAFPTLVTAVQP
jgi:hypothetical protein